MRRLLRYLGRMGLVVLALVLLLAAPVAYTETMCQGSATPTPSTPLATETRSEIRTLLTYPEWHIVHAYDDYAEVIAKGAPHDFGYLRAISGYWTSLCTLTTQSAELGEIDGDTKSLVYVIGVSFTAEMVMKALYEETFGRIAVMIRGDARTPLDELSAAQAANYARFLQQTPWYLYDFRADAAVLEAFASSAFRDRERAFALGLEHAARAAYAGVIEDAVAATGQDDLTLQMVVRADALPIVERTEGVRVLRRFDDLIEIETPRYRRLTGILAEWADQGVDFVDMAGNDQIMFTALSDAARVEGALLSLPRQGYVDTRHLFLVPVADLAERLRNFETVRLEHIHDY